MSESLEARPGRILESWTVGERLEGRRIADSLVFSPPASRAGTGLTLVFLSIPELEIKDLHPPASPLITRIAVHARI